LFVAPLAFGAFMADGLGRRKDYKMFLTLSVIAFVLGIPFYWDVLNNVILK
jgi:hypothetical protein